jgi:hypothetical protein
MARPCVVCTHKSRAEIEAAAVGPEPNRRVATRFRITESSLRRHMESHVPRALAVAAEARELARADTLAGQVRDLQAHANRLRATAERDGDVRAALMAVKTLADLVELLLKAQTADREHSGTGHVQEMHKEAARLAELTGVPAEEILETAAKIANLPG